MNKLRRFSGLPGQSERVEYLGSTKRDNELSLGRRSGCFVCATFICDRISFRGRLPHRM